jgi:hypothetical protein
MKALLVATALTGLFAAPASAGPFASLPMAATAAMPGSDIIEVKQIRRAALRLEQGTQGRLARPWHAAGSGQKGAFGLRKAHPHAADSKTAWLRSQVTRW